MKFDFVPTLVRFLHLPYMYGTPNRTMIFWYQKLSSDIRNYFLISENATIFWYQKLFSDIRNSCLFSDIRNSSDFLISEIDFLILENDFLISENQFMISENHHEFLISKNYFLISENHFLISEIGTIFSCEQAELSKNTSFRPSVCPPSVTPFSCSHHEIFRSDYQWQKWYPCKGQGQRSKVKVTEVKT